jgi:biopolymer transport protein ExbD
MDFERTKRRVHEINLTALIDIVFHLMVFVMLTTTFVVSESMELSLPSAHAKPIAGAADSAVMRIHIIHDGSVTVDGQPMVAAQLTTALAARLAGNPESRIAIFTTAGVSVQQLVSVMDTVYLTGGRNVQVDKVL